MISVIIATMWKCDRLKETLRELDLNEIVGEILLFDNTDNTTKITDIKKLNHILFHFFECV